MEKSQQNPESKEKIANLKNNDDFTQNTSVKPMQAREKNRRKKELPATTQKFFGRSPLPRNDFDIRGNFSSKFALKKKRH